MILQEYSTYDDFLHSNKKTITKKNPRTILSQFFCSQATIVPDSWWEMKSFSTLFRFLTLLKTLLRWDFAM